MYIYIYIYTHYFIYILYLCVALYNLFMDIFLFFLTNVSTAFSFVFPLVCCSFIFYSICTSNEQTSSTFRWTNHNHCPQLGWRQNIYPLTKDAQPFTTKNAIYYTFHKSRSLKYLQAVGGQKGKVVRSLPLWQFT